MSIVIEVQIKKAKIHTNTELFGKMDPYIRFEMCSQTFRTKTKDEGA